MKIVIAVLSIIFVLSLVWGGYLYLLSGDLRNQLKYKEQERSLALKQLADFKEEVKKSREQIEAIGAVLDSFVAADSIKVSSIDKKKAALAKKQIEGIADSKQKETALKKWDLFRDSLKVAELQKLLIELSLGLEQNLKKQGY